MSVPSRVLAEGLLIGITIGQGMLFESAWASSWPEVVPSERQFDVDAAHPEVATGIRGADGRVLYRLECDNWLYEGDRTLLTDNPHATRDWESRARFLVPELLGKCGEYPEYGRVRTFRLRGMKLRLALTNIKVVPSSQNATAGPFALQSFTLTVKMEREPGARSSPAECGQGYRSQ